MVRKLGVPPGISVNLTFLEDLGELVHGANVLEKRQEQVVVLLSDGEHLVGVVLVHLAVLWREVEGRAKEVVHALLQVALHAVGLIPLGLVEEDFVLELE